ncbi:uncharacterized protein LOC111355114 [Spodoptera litura]|uniref:Uncharacterized protein LOC111355114 n=1 Tax=Spodoptera litura TaxID=69820 RepID=A0A9J7E5N9_SPOLT|nr:uncharacterized protein LOC111355114 [Spodoptera litura]
MDLEEAVDNPSEQYAEREEFEKLYYTLVASSRQLIGSARGHLTGDSASEVVSDTSHKHKHSSVRLPKIELPKFSGSYHDWLEFRDTFISIIHKNEDIDKVNKLHYLRASLKGSASLIIDNLEFGSDNYDAAWELLCSRYDNKRLLVNNHVQAIFNLNGINKESSKSLRHIVDTVNKNLRALSTLGQPVQHWDTLIIYIMTSKLDQVTNREWEEHRNSLADPPTLGVFVNFISSRADLLETLEESKPFKYKTESIVNNTHKSKSFAVTYESSNSKPLSCPICKESHFLFQCNKFRILPVQDRIKKAHTSNVCLNCLRPGHYAQKCKLGHCRYCTEKHNTLLHTDKESPNMQNIVLSANHLNTSRVVLLSTALVKVSDAEGNHHDARVLLDNGSTANFISEDFCRKLRIHTYPIKSQVKGINNQSSACTHGCTILLKSRHSEAEIDLNCHVISKVSSSIPNTFINTNHIRLPSNIVLADPNFHTPSCIDILVGAEIFWGIIGTTRIPLGKNMPTLVDSKLGWLVTGVLQQPNKLSSHSFSFVTLTDDLRLSLNRFWELDSVQPQYKQTCEERSCEDIFVETTFRDTDGRFVVTIPLKESPDVLGDSYSMAKRRFLSLERRLAKDPYLKQLYVSFMTEYIELGHMSECSHLNTTYSYSNYLPHHGVLNESKSTTKLRVVFDASARTASGKSFNDIQMVGSPLQDDLLTILLRFRQHMIVVSADIEKMYRVTRVNDMHKPLQKILWRAEPTHPLKTYTLNTVTYGTASAPFLATRCLMQLAKECDDPSTRSTIEHDFYVDDYLSGSSSVREAVDRCRNVIAVLKTGKYNLRKWQSNSRDVLKAICEDQVSSDFVTLSENESSKTLGLNWSCSSDTFYFSISVTPSTSTTKRQILSTISQIFDPIGLVVPCIVEAKILMQRLWLKGCSWDEPVSEEFQNIWSDFLNTLPLLNQFKIPRWVSCESVASLQLHVFTDASERAYGACVYIRSESKGGKVHSHLLTAKSKVAPVKSMTIPRLELCAALLGSRLYVKARQSLTLQFDEIYFWCDSTIVLGWLSASPTQLKTFVRHRVSEIQETTAGRPWLYVPSFLNPADLASRGLRADKLLSSSLWWSGPQYLLEGTSSWPQFPTSTHHDLKLPETASSYHVDIPNKTEILICSLFPKHSSNLYTLQRMIAYVLRFYNKCRRQSSAYGALTSTELNSSLHFLCRLSQQESFSEEYSLLLAGKQLPAKNKLLSLSPFLDTDSNLIRVGGRLSNSFYDYNIKHPILLSCSHIVCKLLFNMYHSRLLHPGPQLLLATIRHHFYPLGGRNLAKKVTHQCVKCCRIKASTIQPVMGNLPEQRLHLEFPFLDSGVDYAGPIMIADRKGRGCRLVKCFICVFVCLATRAVHLELVSDLTKEAFLAAMNRFIARRGKPRNIFSDNGTTFVGAFNELANLLSQDLRFDVVDPGINFSFIPAYTPHFGGLWESAVKSTKHHLRRVLGLTNLTFEEMATCLIQVEAILNSRPLTPLSNDPSDLISLTPAHFLIGRSLVMLPHPQIESTNISNLQRFRRIECLKQHFWNRFSQEYILWLQERTKWQRSSGELKEGTLVVIKDKGLPPLLWLLGRITRVLPGRDGIARVADIRTRRGVIRRAFNTICPLPVSVEDSSTGGGC